MTSPLDPAAPESVAALRARLSAALFGSEWELHPRVRVGGRWRDTPTWLPSQADPSDPPEGTSAGQTPPGYEWWPPASAQLLLELGRRGFALDVRVNTDDRPGGWTARITHRDLRSASARGVSVPDAVARAADRALASASV